MALTWRVLLSHFMTMHISPSQCPLQPWIVQAQAHVSGGAWPNQELFQFLHSALPMVVGRTFDHRAVIHRWIAASHVRPGGLPPPLVLFVPLCVVYQRPRLPIVLECARCFLPCSRLMAVTEHVMPGLFPCLADLWHVASSCHVSIGDPDVAKEGFSCPCYAAATRVAASLNSRVASLCHLTMWHVWVDCWLQPPLPRALKLVRERNSLSMSAQRSAMLGTLIPKSTEQQEPCPDGLVGSAG